MHANVLSALLLLSSVLASHSSTANSHARRSLESARRQDARDILPVDLGLPNILPGLGDNGNSPDGGASSTPNASPTDPATASNSAASTPAADPPPPTTTPTTAPTDTNTNTATNTNAATDSNTATGNTASTTAAPAATTTPNDGIGNIVSSLLGDGSSLVSGAASALSSVAGGVAGGLTNILDPTSVSDTSSPTSVSTSDSAASTDASSQTTSAAPSTITTDPASSDSSSASSTDGGILSSILNPITSALSSIVDPITSAASSVLDPVTSILLPVSTPDSSDSATPSVTDTPTPSSIITDAPASSSAPPDPISSIFSQLSSIVVPPVSSDPPSSAVPTSTPDITSTPDVSIPISTPPPSSVPSDVPSSVPVSVPASSDPVVSVPASSTEPVVSVPASSTAPVISFPGSSDISSGVTSAPLSASTTLASDTDAPFITTITSISVDPALSFVLTESSLALASAVPTTSLTTLTDPDQVTSTADPLATSQGAATTIVAAALPTGIPGRILPSDQLPTNTDLTGYTLIAIKLDTTDLNWAFVVSSGISSSQIFAYMPVLISAALGITGDKIKTYALQVYVPTTYRSAADLQELGTMWLGYIPTDLVDQLAAEIKAKQSPFYTAVADPVAKSLAQRVDSGFSITSVAGTSGLPPSDGSGGSSVSASSATSSSKSRQDAIIGVVSALGAIALLVLVFLVYRSMKRRKQLAHHRLSDPPVAGLEGLRPEGREFDEDSVGGARRRSFYFAEDSLRGYQGERHEDVQYDSRTSPIMSQRRNVVPATISAPILRENTMNW